MSTLPREHRCGSRSTPEFVLFEGCDGYITLSEFGDERGPDDSTADYGDMQTKRPATHENMDVDDERIANTILSVKNCAKIGLKDRMS